MTSTMLEASRPLALVLGQPKPRFVPAPGIYPGTPESTYHHEWDAVSNSWLSLLKQSPAHLKAYLSEPQKETDALRAGHAIHSAILEPELFTSRYVVAEQCGARKKGDGLRCTNNGILLSRGDWYCGVHGKGLSSDPGFDILSLDHFETAVHTRDSVHLHAKAHALLSGEGQHELSIVWDDIGSIWPGHEHLPATGVRCRARIDRHSPLIIDGAIIDIKSTVDASKRAFATAIWKYGYHRQGALYLEGAAANGIPVRHYVIIAVEKEPPYAVGVYRLTEGTLQLGAEQLRPLLARYKECREKNEWPAYSPDVEDITVPDYAWKQADEDLKEVA